MCGIAGVAGPGVSQGDVDRAVFSLRHRGPDAEGTATGMGWALGHTRLSIVDLSAAGNQPISNEDGSLIMVFNGEIYNSPELRRLCEAKGHRFRSDMDGEVILHLWEMEGTAALSLLNGIFAVAVVSTTTGQITLARDPLGVKPLFYSSREGDRLWFASELSALAAIGVPLGAHDQVALAQFLSFLWVPDPRTPFQGAKAVEPGHALTFVDGRTSQHPYGEPLVPASGQQFDYARPQAVVELRERFAAAARRQLLSDVPVGLMASGGIDSSLIWWATRDHLTRAYTIRWSADEGGGGERLSEDAAAVVGLEASFGTPVEFLEGEAAEDQPLPPSGDLFADPAYELTRQIARAARDEGHKVLFSGQGGDELFAGYRRHSVALWVNRIRLGRGGTAAERAVLEAGRRTGKGGTSVEYSARLARAMAERDPFRAYMQLCTYSTARDRAEALGCEEAEVADDVVWQRHQEVYDNLPAGLSFLRKAMMLDLRVYLPGLGLAYVDRAGMEFGVEVRVPWLDLELTRWSLRLPDSLLVHHGRRKWLPKALATEVLGRSMARRPKRGFAAPARRLAGHPSPQGERGFRQGLYFARARGILDSFLRS
ncbi:MAG TPA: asparagine synthase (glutamine-hydrolyzing) [Acidimicrobiales bacterium]|nr:asparagine synthase (glutamine-hydrolyzing) [Acidimicrobiales bacterium]